MKIEQMQERCAVVAREMYELAVGEEFIVGVNAIVETFSLAVAGAGNEKQALWILAIATSRVDFMTKYMGFTPKQMRAEMDKLTVVSMAKRH